MPDILKRYLCFVFTYKCHVWDYVIDNCPLLRIGKKGHHLYDTIIIDISTVLNLTVVKKRKKNKLCDTIKKDQGLCLYCKQKHISKMT